MRATLLALGLRRSFGAGRGRPPIRALDGADLVADVLADALAVGELAYLPGGSDQGEIASLGQILAGQRQVGGGARIVFDSVGSAVVDAAAVALVLAAAQERKVPLLVDVWAPW